jgi:glutamine phosphoribosylpyrophosphate amidotransferase
VSSPPDKIDIDQAPDSAALPQHECGLFGVFGHPNAAVLTYYGLFALQHRGQESAGIVTCNGPDTSFLMHKDMGLVSQVFGQDELAKLKGTRAIGHTPLLDDGHEHDQKCATLRGRLRARPNGYRSQWQFD